MNNARDKIIIALDNLDFSQALQLVDYTRDYAQVYKIGLAMYLSYGEALIEKILERDLEIFLDLKFHDIPMQVGSAVQAALRFRPRYLTIHALGGEAMIKEALKKTLHSDTTLLAVTILSSTDKAQWRNLGFLDIEKAVLNLAQEALGLGLTALVSSAAEASMLKQSFGPELFLVCPGIRSAHEPFHDQSRVMSAYEAIRAGADALVIGRPISQALNKAQAAHNIYKEVERALYDKK
jgi:orotidine-5'-phosphate decarboxylase